MTLNAGDIYKHPRCGNLFYVVLSRTDKYIKYIQLIITDKQPLSLSFEYDTTKTETTFLVERYTQVDDPKMIALIKMIVML